MVIDPTKVARLRELAISQRAIQDEVEQWWLENVKPLVDSCKTWDEFRESMKGLGDFSDADGQWIEAPGLWGVYLAFASDSFRQRAQEREVLN
jgi:hypothetical protein